MPVARAFLIFGSCALPPTLADVGGVVSRLGTLSTDSEKGRDKANVGRTLREQCKTRNPRSNFRTVRQDEGGFVPQKTDYFQNIFFVAYLFCSPNLTAQNIIFVAHPNCSPDLNAQNILFVAHEC